MNRIVPDRGIEKFLSRVIWTVNEQVEADAERHTVRADIRDHLERDPTCRHETTKPLPADIHPNYTGAEPELWQKPASKVDFMDGSQGPSNCGFPSTRRMQLRP